MWIELTMMWWVFISVHHGVVDGVVRGGAEVVAEEADLFAGGAVGTRTSRRHRGRSPRGSRRTRPLFERLPHRSGRGARPGDEDQVGGGVADLLREGRELRRVLRDEFSGHRGALAAEHRGHPGEVALAKRGVLCEDEDFLALGAADEGSGGGDILEGLPSGAEGVIVDARDRIRCGRAGDVQHLVLFCLFGQRQGDAGGGGARHDLVALADEVLGGGDRLVAVPGIVRVADVQLVPVDLAGALGLVIDAGFEPGQVGRTVGRQRAGL